MPIFPIVRQAVANKKRKAEPAAIEKDRDVEMARPPTKVPPKFVSKHFKTGKATAMANKTMKPRRLQAPVGLTRLDGSSDKPCPAGVQPAFGFTFRSPLISFPPMSPTINKEIEMTDAPPSGQPGPDTDAEGDIQMTDV